jgi:hypothetical protein
VSRWVLLWWVVGLLGCSDLDEGAGGVVALEVQTPDPATVEVGEQLALAAQALDKDGNPVVAEITWRAADATLTVDPLTGVVTGVAPGPGRVQAFAGLLGSDLISFNVIARADTLIVTDSLFTVPPGGTTSPLLVSQLQSFSPAGPLPARPVVYTLLSPVDASVTLTGGVLADTLDTGTDGAVSSVTLTRVNSAQPVTAIVAVSASRTRGAAVPGSGQRFTVTFQ